MVKKNLTLLQGFMNPNVKTDVLELKLWVVVSEDGVAGLANHHGFAIEPNDDIDGTIDAAVVRINTNLANLKMTDGEVRNFPPISEESVAWIKTKAHERWTPPVLAAWNEARAQVKSEHEAEIAAQDAEAFKSLEKWRFWAVLELNGITQKQVYAAVDKIPDPTTRVTIRARLTDPPNGSYHRDDPQFENEALLTEVGLTVAGVDQLWTVAKSL